MSLNRPDCERCCGPDDHPTCSKPNVVQARHPGACCSQVQLSVVCLQLQLSVCQEGVFTCMPRDRTAAMGRKESGGRRDSVPGIWFRSLRSMPQMIGWPPCSTACKSAKGAPVAATHTDQAAAYITHHTAGAMLQLAVQAAAHGAPSVCCLPVALCSHTPAQARSSNALLLGYATQGTATASWLPPAACAADRPTAMQRQRRALTGHNHPTVGCVVYGCR